mmetsp:Transcript_45960/g.127578  ORF Transcript_45960/g.127578 Transcript_45960/m.127578 type:complete len:228 (+) Transcript_45960:145-828(+)
MVDAPQPSQHLSGILFVVNLVGASGAQKGQDVPILVPLLELLVIGNELTPQAVDLVAIVLFDERLNGLGRHIHAPCATRRNGQVTEPPTERTRRHVAALMGFCDDRRNRLEVRDLARNVFRSESGQLIAFLFAWNPVEGRLTTMINRHRPCFTRPIAAHLAAQPCRPWFRPPHSIKHGRRGVKRAEDASVSCEAWWRPHTPQQRERQPTSSDHCPRPAKHALRKMKA